VLEQAEFAQGAGDLAAGFGAVTTQGVKAGHVERRLGVNLLVTSAVYDLGVAVPGEQLGLKAVGSA
jgi:hypothetical protein